MKKKKLKSAMELGRLGGKARAKNMTAEARSEAARLAVQQRWQNRDQGGKAATTSDSHT
jgi:hypothetical protein